jgi:hypothetical protein
MTTTICPNSSGPTVMAPPVAVDGEDRASTTAVTQEEPWSGFRQRSPSSAHSVARTRSERGGNASPKRRSPNQLSTVFDPIGASARCTTVAEVCAPLPRPNRGIGRPRGPDRPRQSASRPVSGVPAAGNLAPRRGKTSFHITPARGRAPASREPSRDDPLSSRAICRGRGNGAAGSSSGSGPAHHGHAAMSHACHGSRVLRVCVAPPTRSVAHINSASATTRLSAGW